VTDKAIWFLLQNAFYQGYVSVYALG